MGYEQSDDQAQQIPEMDSGEKRLNELGYKQELRREMNLFKTFAISFSTMTLFTGITPLYGSSLLYAGPATLVWGWVLVTFFTWFVGIAMAEICSSFPTTGSLYFWAAHLAGPKWGPFASWCCAWLETIGLIAGMGTQAYAGSQTLQSIILLCTGTNKDGGYFAPKWLFLCMYMGLTAIWAVLNTFALEVIAFIDVISIWWQVIGGLVIVIMLPLVALTTQSASYVFTKFDTSPEQTGVSSKPYAVILSFLVSQYSLYGYDAAAHLTEETKGADKNGPIAILSSIGIISVFGWAYILALTFSIQDFGYLYDTSNETAGAFVPAQILYDAFHGRYHSSTGAIILLFVIWGSFFFGGLSITTSAARVVYALSRDKGVPFSSVWRKVHPKHKVPSNAVWLCAAICILLGLPILKVNVVFTAITSICTIGWVGGYAVPIFARMVMAEKNFKPGPFYLGKASRPICLVAFLWICYTCAVFLLPTYYPISWNTFNYAPVALTVGLGLIMLWWVLDARKWFKGPVRNFEMQNEKVNLLKGAKPSHLELGWSQKVTKMLKRIGISDSITFHVQSISGAIRSNVTGSLELACSCKTTPFPLCHVLHFFSCQISYRHGRHLELCVGDCFLVVCSKHNEEKKYIYFEREKGVSGGRGTEAKPSEEGDEKMNKKKKKKSRKKPKNSSVVFLCLGFSFYF